MLNPELDLLTSAAIALGFIMILLNIIAGIGCVVFFFTISAMSDYFKLKSLELELDKTYICDTDADRVFIDLEVRNTKRHQTFPIRLKGNLEKWNNLTKDVQVDMLELWLKKNNPGCRYWGHIVIYYTNPLKV